MLIRGLPTEQQEQFHSIVERAGESWELMQGLTIQQAADWFKARTDDSAARLERRFVRDPCACCDHACVEGFQDRRGR